MEVSADRAEFLARLFSRKRPAGLDATTPRRQAVWGVCGRAGVQGPVRRDAGSSSGPVCRKRARVRADRDATTPASTSSWAISSRQARSCSIRARRWDARGIRRLPSCRWPRTPRGWRARYLATEEQLSRRARPAAQEPDRAAGRPTSAGPRRFARSGRGSASAAPMSRRSTPRTWSSTSSRSGNGTTFAGNVAALPLDETSTLIRSCFNMCTSPDARVARPDAAGFDAGHAPGPSGRNDRQLLRRPGAPAVRFPDGPMNRPRLLAGRLALVLAACWAIVTVETAPQIVAPASMPSALTSAQFWKLSADLSEPAGSFRSENLVSNEHTLSVRDPRAHQTGACRAACIWAWPPIRTSRTWRRCARAWRSSSTSAAATCCSTCCTRRCSSCRPIARSFVSRLFTQAAARRPEGDVDGVRAVFGLRAGGDERRASTAAISRRSWRT